MKKWRTSSGTWVASYLRPSSVVRSRVISGGAASSSAVRLQQVYLDSVDNLRLGEASPPLVP